MTGLLAFALKHWKLIGGALAVLAVVFMVNGHIKADAKARKDRDAAIASATKWKAAAKGWEASYRLSEDLRGQEAVTAVTAVSEAARACDARVASARRSARTIETIVTKEPPRDQAGCPVRESVSADLVRDALQPR